MGFKRHAVPTKLKFKKSFFGFGLEDVAILMGLYVFFQFFAQFGLYSGGTGFLLLFVSMIILAIFKRSKPEGYWEAKLQSVMRSKRLSHKVRSAELPPFPLER